MIYSPIMREVRHFHERSRGVYGYRKVAVDIREEGEFPCCAETVRRVMRESRLCTRRKHKFTVTGHVHQKIRRYLYLVNV